MAARYGESGTVPYLLPLSVDGLVVAASITLVEISGRLDALTGQPHPRRPDCAATPAAPPRQHAAAPPRAAVATVAPLPLLGVDRLALSDTTAPPLDDPRPPLRPGPASSHRAAHNGATVTPRGPDTAARPPSPADTAGSADASHQGQPGAVDGEPFAPATADDIGTATPTPDPPGDNVLDPDIDGHDEGGDDALLDALSTTATAVAYWRRKDPTLQPKDIARKIKKTPRTVRRYWSPTAGEAPAPQATDPARHDGTASPYSDGFKRRSP